MDIIGGFKVFCDPTGYLVKTKIWNSRKFKTKIVFVYIFPDNKALVKEDRIMVNPKTFKLLKNTTQDKVKDFLDKIEVIRRQ